MQLSADQQATPWIGKIDEIVRVLQLLPNTGDNPRVSPNTNMDTIINDPSSAGQEGPVPPALAWTSRATLPPTSARPSTILHIGIHQSTAPPPPDTRLGHAEHTDGITELRRPYSFTTGPTLASDAPPRPLASWDTLTRSSTSDIASIGADNTTPGTTAPTPGLPTLLVDPRTKSWDFPWVRLAASDESALQRTADQVSQSTTLDAACRFVSEILLLDFPAEVFLQRPAIVHALLRAVDPRGFAGEGTRTLTMTATRGGSLVAVDCLRAVVLALQTRIRSVSNTEWSTPTDEGYAHYPQPRVDVNTRHRESVDPSGLGLRATASRNAPRGDVAPLSLTTFTHAVFTTGTQLLLLDLDRLGPLLVLLRDAAPLLRHVCRSMPRQSGALAVVRDAIGGLSDAAMTHLQAHVNNVVVINLAIFTIELMSACVPPEHASAYGVSASTSNLLQVLLRNEYLAATLPAVRESVLAYSRAFNLPGMVQFDQTQHVMADMKTAAEFTITYARGQFDWMGVPLEQRLALLQATVPGVLSSLDFTEDGDAVTGVFELIVSITMAGAPFREGTGIPPSLGPQHPLVHTLTPVLVNLLTSPCVSVRACVFRLLAASTNASVSTERQHACATLLREQGVFVAMVHSGLLEVRDPDILGNARLIFLSVARLSPGPGGLGTCRVCTLIAIFLLAASFPLVEIPAPFSDPPDPTHPLVTLASILHTHVSGS